MINAVLFSLIYIVPNHNKFHLKALQSSSPIQANYNQAHCDPIIIQYN